MKIAFRVDGSYKIGSGHFMRSIVLAQELRKKIDPEIIFISYKHIDNFNHIPEKFGFKSISFAINGDWSQDKDAEYLLEGFKGEFFDYIIIDNYDLDNIWELKIKKICKKILVIDDLANRKHSCDYLLDQNYVDNFLTRYNGLINPNCDIFLGTKYVLLRDEFLEIKNKSKIRNHGLKSLLISFGGSDPKNLTIKILNIIKNINYTFESIDVVIGSKFHELKILNNLCDSIPNSKIHIDTNHISKLMLEADLCIGAGGTTSWERCFLKLPSLIISVADNQIEISKSLHQIGAAYYFGNESENVYNQLKDYLIKLIETPYILEKMSLNTQNIMNAESFLGAEYLCKKIFNCN
ncbi:UDP-2,4-diacetamido-2,4,6-trideoxy-beta-L-altropyranose hydrolase [Silvanigrella sp.]|jgi:UDP-2,4-diacetamido-2,4,6-trideoxy-beta-L-altropyranose hydrolase|uniref:UDP-2,4-diacetamido-2,4, 6-trideoxy-beta-L-altropyranose hydrolase n=1 Tax=Silvanigrella sp. TaxID=2024976 RepID=UPI0037CAD721